MGNQWSEDTPPTAATRPPVRDRSSTETTPPSSPARTSMIPTPIYSDPYEVIPLSIPLTDLPSELINEIASYFCRSVPSLFLFASLCRKFKEIVVDEGHVCKQLIQARWPGFPIVVGAVPFSEQLRFLYRCELSPYFAFRMSVLSKIFGETGAYGKLESDEMTGGEAARNGILRQERGRGGHWQKFLDHVVLWCEGRKRLSESESESESDDSSDDSDRRSSVLKAVANWSLVHLSEFVVQQKVPPVRSVFSSWFAGRGVFFAMRSGGENRLLAVLEDPIPEEDDDIVADGTEILVQKGFGEESLVKLRRMYCCFSKEAVLVEEIPNDQFLNFFRGGVAGKRYVLTNETLSRFLRMDCYYLSLHPNSRTFAEVRPFVFSLGDLLRDKLVFWALDGVLQAPYETHFLRVVLFLLETFIVHENLLHLGHGTHLGGIWSKRTFEALPRSSRWFQDGYFEDTKRMYSSPEYLERTATKRGDCVGIVWGKENPKVDFRSMTKTPVKGERLLFFREFRVEAIAYFGWSLLKGALVVRSNSFEFGVQRSRSVGFTPLTF